MLLRMRVDPNQCRQRHQGERVLPVNLKSACNAPTTIRRALSRRNARVLKLRNLACAVAYGTRGRKYLTIKASRTHGYPAWLRQRWAWTTIATHVGRLERGYMTRMPGDSRQLGKNN